MKIYTGNINKVVIALTSTIIIMGFLQELNAQTPVFTWESGSDNRNQQFLVTTDPGGRAFSISWLDASGHFKIFGGRGYGHDLWRYEPDNGKWTWESGTTDSFDPPVYGTKGVGSTSHIPGTRDRAVSWLDTAGVFWLFGGFGVDTTNNVGLLNDLWKYDPVTKEWTWVTGSISRNQAGTYGTKGVSNPANTPGGRENSVSWADKNGNLWLFGGSGYDKDGGPDFWLSDLWKFNIASGEWTWVSGSNIHNEVANHGTKGVSAPTNDPGAREKSGGWIDSSEDLWLFGGSTWSPGSRMNDVWKYDTGTGEWTWMSGDNSAGELGVYGTKGVADPANKPGGRDDPLVVQDTASGIVWIYGGWGPLVSGFTRLNDLWKYDPGTNQWTWVSGNESAPFSPNYGTKGVPDANNLPGGRYASLGWVDGQGDIWIFGGSGGSGLLGDVWKYDITTGFWTWMAGRNMADLAPIFGDQGLGSTYYNPGGKSNVACTWTGSSDTLWLMGGMGYDVLGGFGPMNDLWKYDPVSGVWTWVGGSDQNGQSGQFQTMGVPGGRPGGREDGMSFKEELTGRFWLFGGYAEDDVGNAGPMNDLWRYIPAIDQWTWMSGNELEGQPGIYGTKGVGSTSNTPGGREAMVGFTDHDGNFLVFGGTGFDKNGNDDNLNDLWKYEVSSGEWTWMSGGDTINHPGSWGIKGMASANNVPSPRQSAVGWTGPNGNLWLLGGIGLDLNGSGGYLNDLWKYDVLTDQWTWIGGSNLQDTGGSYGTIGVPDPSNMPGGREGAIGWTGPDGHLWLMGGFGLNKDGASAWLNDFWKYDVDLNQWTWIAGSDVGDQGGTYGVQGIGSINNIPGSRSNSGVWVNSSNEVWLFGANGRDGNGNGGSLNDLWKITFIPFSTSITGFAGVSQTGFTVSWDSVDYAESFELDISTDNFTTFLPGYNAKSVTMASEPVTGLSTGTTYQVRVRAVSSSGTSTDSQTSSIITAPDTPNATAASGVTQSSFTANWDAVTGADSYFIDVRDDAAVFVSGFNNQPVTGTSVDVTGLSAGTNYNYVVRSTNSGGTSPNSNMIDQVTIPADPTAEQATQVTFNSFKAKWGAVSGADSYQLDVSDDDFATFVTGYNSKSISGAFEEVVSTLQPGTTYKYRVRAVSTGGASGNSNVISLTTLLPPETPVPGLVFGASQTSYQILAIPLSGTSASVSSIFFDDLGTYNPELWRLWNYIVDQNREFQDGFTNIERGKGYWLIIRDQSTITLDGSILEFNPSAPHTITLNQGWTQIGNPFNHNISWTDVLNDNSNPAGVDVAVKVYEGQWKDVDVLQKFRGGFIFSDNAVTVQISETVNTTIQGGRFEPVVTMNNLDQAEWEVRINLESDGFVYGLGGIGMHPSANSSKDEFDEMTPPRFLNYLDLNFSHPEYFNNQFTRDVVPSAEGHVWEFVTETNLTGEVQMSWDNSYFGSNNRELILFDLTTQTRVNMREENSYSFPASEKREFRVAYGSGKYVDQNLLPTGVTLGQAYPNPFSRVTTIPFTIPDSESSFQVDLTIVNLTGKRINTLFSDEMSGGSYEINWDGRDLSGHAVSTGVYLFRLRVSGEDLSETRHGKLIFK